MRPTPTTPVKLLYFQVIQKFHVASPMSTYLTSSEQTYQSFTSFPHSCNTLVVLASPIPALPCFLPTSVSLFSVSLVGSSPFSSPKIDVEYLKVFLGPLLSFYTYAPGDLSFPRQKLAYCHQQFIFLNQNSPSSKLVYSIADLISQLVQIVSISKLVFPKVNPYFLALHPTFTLLPKNLPNKQ